MSDREKVALLQCPFCGATPHQNLLPKRSCQLHGEEMQEYKVFCPHHCASFRRLNKKMAIDAWNTRALTPLRSEDVTEPGLLECLQSAVAIIDMLGSEEDSVVRIILQQSRAAIAAAVNAEAKS